MFYSNVVTIKEVFVEYYLCRQFLVFITLSCNSLASAFNNYFRQFKHERKPKNVFLVVAVSPTSTPPPSLPPECLLPEQVGRCSRTVERWRYDLSKKSCVFFVYSGCGGNANNFVSKAECQRTCKGSFSVLVFSGFITNISRRSVL